MNEINKTSVITNSLEEDKRKVEHMTDLGLPRVEIL